MTTDAPVVAFLPPTPFQAFCRDVLRPISLLVFFLTYIVLGFAVDALRQALAINAQDPPGAILLSVILGGLTFLVGSIIATALARRATARSPEAGSRITRP